MIIILWKGIFTTYILFHFLNFSGETSRHVEWIGESRKARKYRECGRDSKSDGHHASAIRSDGETSAASTGSKHRRQLHAGNDDVSTELACTSVEFEWFRKQREEVLKKSFTLTVAEKSTNNSLPQSLWSLRELIREMKRKKILMWKDVNIRDVSRNRNYSPLTIGGPQWKASSAENISVLFSVAISFLFLSFTCSHLKETTTVRIPTKTGRDYLWGLWTGEESITGWSRGNGAVCSRMRLLINVTCWISRRL